MDVRAARPKALSDSLLINLSLLMQQPTGLTTYARQLVPHLRSLQPTLLTAHPFEGFRCIPTPANLTAEHGSRGHLRRLLWTQFQLPKLYRQLGASLLFSPVPETPLWRRTRSVVTVHDLIPLRFGSARSPLRLYFRHYVPQVLRQAAHILCDSEATARDITHFYGLPAHKMTAVPLAYDAEHFRPLSLPTQNYFFYIGRHDPYKNLQRLIAAFGQVQDLPDVELWIAGPADPRFTPALAAQAAELGLAHRVKFLSYVPYSDLPRLLNQAIALVFPSLWEGFGLPVLEAMACGTAVITSNQASVPEVAGDAALLVDPYRPEAIAAAMRQVATDDHARSQLQARSLERSHQFSWERTGQRTAAILRQYL